MRFCKHKILPFCYLTDECIEKSISWKVKGLPYLLIGYITFILIITILGVFVH